MNLASNISKILPDPTSKFQKIIAQSGLEPEIKKVLLGAIVEKVQVLCQTREWKIILKLQTPVFETLSRWQPLTAQILLEVPSLKGVNYQIKYQLPPKNLSWFFDNYKEIFLQYVMSEVPSLVGWFDKATCEIKQEQVIFWLPNRLGLELLLEKNVGELMTQVLSTKFNLKAGFNFEVGKDNGFFKQLESEQTDYRLHVIQQQRLSKKGQRSGNDSANLKQAVERGQFIIGKKIHEAPIAISQIDDEEKSIVIKGILLQLEVRLLKSGRRLYSFDVTDYTNSITAKVFEPEKGDHQLDSLKKGQWVLVRGPVQYDRYTQELTVMAKDVNPAEPVLRVDSASEKRIELHLHSKMSALDGVTDVAAVIETVARWGHQAVAITDHGVLQAFPEAYEAGKRFGVKVIYGVEGYLFEGGTEKQPSFHIIILVKNQTGLENLYKLITLSHLKYFYRKPRIPRLELNRLREGLILGTACEAGELIQAYLGGKSKAELLKIASFYDYIEIQPVGNNEFMIRKGIVDSVEDLRKMNRNLIEMASELNKPVVATGDVHFLHPEDEIFRRILLTGQGYADEPQAPLYLQTTEEMLKEFSYLGEDTAKEVVIHNPAKIAALTETILPIPEDLYPPEIPGAEDQISSMTLHEAKRRYGDVLPGVVKERLDKELNSIISNGFAVLYLIAHKLVKKSNDDGYLVGSRGSVGSSLVATFTGITEVNPLPPHYLCEKCRHSEFIIDGSVNCGADLADKLCPNCNTMMLKDGHDIPFETFLGFNGDKVPDIDLNFSGDYQAKAHKFTEELFGKDYVFRAGTIATIAEKTAFGFVKGYLGDQNNPKRSAEISRLVNGCTGIKRTTGQHPGGLMVVPKYIDVHKFTPLQRPADDPKSDTITTHFDYHSISSRLVKLDILGHDDPTVIKMLEDLTGYDSKTIPLDDPQTMLLFSGVEVLGVTQEQIRSNVGTYGIPEFGTKFVRQMLENTKPKKFSELVRISGFSHGTDVWLNNAQDLIKNGIAQLAEAISTRDDIMLYLIYQGMSPDLSFKIMEDVRKGKGLKTEYEEAMREHGVPDWYISSCKKIKYMFPKAHAVAYVTMAFRIAFFKVNFPHAFYASFFTVRADEFDADLIVQGKNTVRKNIEEIEQKGLDATAKEKNLLTILEVALEMFERGIALHHVDLLQSDAKKFKVIRGKLLSPFAALQGVGNTAAQNIVAAREERPFTSIEDLRIRSKISKTVIEVLKNHGSLKGLDETDQLAFF